MKLRLGIESDRQTPDGQRPPHGGWVAWLEVDGHPVTGALACHADRDTAEVMAAAEVTRRLRRLLDDPDVVDVEQHADGEPADGKPPTN